MILTNGVVRTMDPSLPTAAAAWRLRASGSSAASGRTRARYRRPSAWTCAAGVPSRRSPTPTSTSRRGRWRAATSSSKGATSLAEALSRVSAHAPRGEWVRGHGWRDADWSEHPSRGALDEVTGERPAALWSKDYHSLWLNTAALARAGGDLEVHGGVVERDADGEPTGVLREESAWRFRERHVAVTEDEWVAATRDGLRVANERGVGAIHDKDGWLGAHGIFARIHETGGLTLRVWQSLPAEHVGSARGARPALTDRRRVSPTRLPEDIHGRHAGLADRVDARRERGLHHERRRAR